MSNNSTNANVHCAVIMVRPLREFTQFIWWLQTIPTQWGMAKLNWSRLLVT